MPSDRSFPSSSHQPNKFEKFSGFTLDVVLLLGMIYVLLVFKWLCSPLVDFYIFGFFNAPKSRAGKKKKKKKDGFRGFNKETALLCCQQLWIEDTVSQLYEIYAFYFTVHKEIFHSFADRPIKCSSGLLGQGWRLHVTVNVLLGLTKTLPEVLFLLRRENPSLNQFQLFFFIFIGVTT